ncbi:MAG TPA: hypothetical protein PKI60_07920 [Oscillospiraceae bacterium]|nr:hypothetical protein [Oscillospiraceae bacterium]
MTDFDYVKFFMILLFFLCLILPIVIFAVKIYLYKKMKDDSEDVRIFSKGFMAVGIILLIPYLIIIIYQLIAFFKGMDNNLFPMIATAYLPAWFISSVCFTGNKSMVIGAKRYFYSDIQRIESNYSRYTITSLDGKVKKPVVMFGSGKLNEELKKHSRI